MLFFTNFRLRMFIIATADSSIRPICYINFCNSCSISFFFFFLSDVIEPGSFQKGEIWQSIAGDCLDPSNQAQAKQNLVQGFINVFGWDMGILASNVKITCGEKSEKWRSILSAR